MFSPPIFCDAIADLMPQLADPQRYIRRDSLGH
jgi:hypothetical protein